MACDEALVQRVRELLAHEKHLTEKRMFGGVCFMLKGNMLCGVASDELMLRVGSDAHSAALSRPHARPMDFTGRPMKGYVFVRPEGLKQTAALQSWLSMAVAHVSQLPAKAAKPAKPLKAAKPA